MLSSPEQNFVFYKDHKSIIGPDGNIYIFGGYDDHIKDDNEEFYRSIYMLQVKII